MINKKGFTLIELLAVIAILGLVVAIAVPSIVGIMSRNQEKIDSAQEKEFISIAKLWANDYKNSITDGCYFMSLNDMVEKNLLSEIPNDSDGNKYSQTSGVKITKNGIKLTYAYVQNIGSCNSISGISSPDRSYDEVLTIPSTGAGGSSKKRVKLSEKIKEDNTPISEDKPDFSTVATSDEGLIKDIDEDGETFYFRGAVENNYVKFRGLKWATSDGSYHNAGEEMLWRIVRINGDGTIRLIADGNIGKSKFSENLNDEKYVGYTYDNSAPNVQDGTPSTIKTYLENWYSENMMPYDEYIETSKFCNDTTTRTSGSIIYYGAYDRLYTKKDPSFKCENTTGKYGGEYNLKIGLITADEIIFAGGKISISNSSFYLSGKSSSFWTASPRAVNQDEGFWQIYLGENGGTTDVYFDEGVRPVINLKSDLLVPEATGTIDNPYIIG